MCSVRFPPGSSQDDFHLKRHVRAQAIEIFNKPYEEQLQRTTDDQEINRLKSKMREIG